MHSKNNELCAFYPKRVHINLTGITKYCFYRQETVLLFPVKEQKYRLSLKPWNKPSFMRQGNHFYSTA